MKIVSLGGVCFNQKHKKTLEQIGELIIYNDIPTTDKEIISRIDDCDIVISFLVKISKNVIDISKNLKMICLATTGYDDVDLIEAKNRKIIVSYSPDYSTEAVAEHTIGLMLAAARKSFDAAMELKHGKYDPCKFVGKRLSEKTLGVIGFGRIGKKVAEIAKHGFNMKILTYDITSSLSDLEKLLKESDFITIHLPLTQKTQNIISDKEFGMMKNGVVIVNTARGGIVDEEALLKNLKNGKIFSIGLDVLKNEPMQANDLLININNVIVTPHISFNEEDALFERSRIIIENIKSFLAGKPKNVVF